jgi:hypothetical protein
LMLSPLMFLPFFCDAPLVFPIAPECPYEVARGLLTSFELLWCDVPSAANRVRGAVETLLTERGIARSVVSSHNKRRRLSLHDRITKFRVKNPVAAETLLAIKWLGNEGSHGSSECLTLEDLLDAYELFEHVIDQVYVKRDRKIIRLASAINRKRGPRRKTRRHTG